jgi:hypothetical protein
MTSSRKLAVCKFKNKTFTCPFYSGHVDWSEVVALHAKHDIRADKDGAMLAGYALTGARKNENVELRSLIQLDIDAVKGEGSDQRQLFKAGQPPPTLDTIRGAIEEFEWIAASSHRHDPTNEAVKYRIVMLPDRDIQKDEYRPLLEALDEMLDYALDRAAWSWSQAFYLPSCPKGTADDAFVEHNRGMPLPVDEFVARGRNILKARKPTPGFGRNTSDMSTAE